MTTRAGVATGALVLLFVSAAMPARAQEQAAPAESLFEQGRALLAQQKYAEACAKFAESEKLDPAVGTLLNLGDCYEKQGKIATAWAIFKQAATMAGAAKQPSREKIALARVAAIEGKVPRMSIKVAHPVPGLEIRRDGLLIGEAEWSGAVPSPVTIDPGEHTVVAVAPGKKAWTTKVTLAADGSTTAVEVPELEVDELAERAPAKPAAPPTSTVEVVNTHDRNVQRTIAIATGAVGLVSIAVGIPFGTRAISLNNDAKPLCPTTTTCTAEGASDAQSAVTSGLVSTVLILVGAGVVVGGTVIWFTAPKPKHEVVTSLRLAPAIDARGGGLTVLGRF